jgi:hypothetical protein
LFNWFERILNWIAERVYRRGQAIAGAADQTMQERRDAVRNTVSAIGDAMMLAERDRLHGRIDDQDTAIGAASRATSAVREVDDDEARDLVVAWKRQFDAIPKGWKEGGDFSPPGYPEAEWSELRASAHAAQDRLGLALRKLMDDRK